MSQAVARPLSLAVALAADQEAIVVRGCLQLRLGADNPLRWDLPRRNCGRRGAGGRPAWDARRPSCSGLGLRSPLQVVCVLAGIVEEFLKPAIARKISNGLLNALCAFRDLTRIAGQDGPLLCVEETRIGRVSHLQVAYVLARIVEELLKPTIAGKITNGLINAANTFLELRRIAGHDGPLLCVDETRVGRVSHLQVAYVLARIVEELLKPTIAGKITNGLLNAPNAFLDLRRIGGRGGLLLGGGQIGVGFVAQLQIARDLAGLVEELLKPAVLRKISDGLLRP